MDPPSRPSAQRAADTDREAAAALVQAAGGDGRLSLEELEQRLGAVLSARTRAELDRLTADLRSGVDGGSVVAASASASGHAPTPDAAAIPGSAPPLRRRRRGGRHRRAPRGAAAAGTAATGTVTGTAATGTAATGTVTGTAATVAVLRAVRRGGVWCPAPTGRVITVLGEAVIDLRAVDLDRVTELAILTVLGVTTVLIPDQIVLEVTEVAVLADHDLDAVGRPRPTAPVLRLSLRTVMGRVRLRSGPSPDLSQDLYA